MSEKTPTVINEFTVIPTSYSKAIIHYMYGRLHTGSKRGTNPWPSGRTLFLVNLPPDATEREVIQFFKSSGTVERVCFDYDEKDLAEGLPDSSDESEEEEEKVEEEEEEDNDAESQPKKRRKITKVVAPKVISLLSKQFRTLRPSGRSAHIVFLDSSSIERCLSSPSKPRTWPQSSSEVPSGLSHYLSLYQTLRPPLDVVRDHADSYMELYEYQQALERQKSKYKKGEAIVDEDGFTLVTRGGAYGKTLGGGVAVATKLFEETGKASKRHTKKKVRDQTTFYAFQKAEKQRQELLNLRKNWEAEKEKVEKLKASRVFRPY